MYRFDFHYMENDKNFSCEGINSVVIDNGINGVDAIEVNNDEIYKYNFYLDHVFILRSDNKSYFVSNRDLILIKIEKES